MGFPVLVVWLIQAAVGVTLLVSWARHENGRNGSLIVPHAAMMLAFVVPWTVFIVTGAVGWAWAGFTILLVFIGFGDATMVRRARAVTGAPNSGLRDYGPAIAVAVSGRLGRRVIFHALFSAVVFFGCLAVCIAATVAAAS
jgi:hypothetical protein